MKIFNRFKRKLKSREKLSRVTTSGYVTGLDLGNKSSTSIVFSSGNTWQIHPHELDQLIAKIVDKIDEKNMSDYEFREWLRDNLSSCEYQSEFGRSRYVKTEDIRPISVLDTMIEMEIR